MWLVNGYAIFQLVFVKMKSRKCRYGGALGEWRGGTSPLRSSSCAPHGAQPSQKPACRFPARASSAVDSQYGEGLHPCKRDVQPRTPQRKRFLNLLKFLPNYAAPLAATGKHLTPVALCKAVDPME